MLFSCKISHAVLLHIEQQNEDLERLEQTLYEKFDLPPIEFLKDPSCWLKAKQMEDFLEHVVSHYKSSGDELSLLSFVGHQSKDLRAWGVLDSVLRMLQSPQDVFLQPQRFLSYFVSPPPPVANVKHSENSVILDLPIAASEFPRVVEYLKAAIESLPTYLGQSLAHVAWEESNLSIEWCNRQANLLEEIETEKALHPELMQDILRDLEHSQKQIEQLQINLQAKTEELEMLRQGAKLPEASAPDSRVGQSMEMNLSSENVKSMPLQPTVSSSLTQGLAPEVLSDSIEVKLQESLQSLYRLADYMARGQQLVTMLVGQNRATPQVKEAMRRVDWERVQNSSIQHFKEVIGNIQDLNQVIKDSAKLPQLQTRNDYQNKISSDQTHWII